MAEYIKRLITEGEGQKLDFKYEISDFRKIARTLVAFSNTDGGKLLIGVKDNGAVAGVRSEEEYYMIEGAAQIYCKPEIRFTTREWQLEGRKILEVMITPGDQKPYKAQDQEGRWIAYIRQGDQNFRASSIILKLWQRQKSGRSTTVKFRQPHQFLLSYLEDHTSITISKYRRLVGLSAVQAEGIIVDFILLGLLEAKHTSLSCHFSLSANYQAIIRGMDQYLYNKV